MIKRVVTCLCFLAITFYSNMLYCQATFSQVDYDRSVSFPSPTAASLGKFGFIPISFSSGTVNISLPVWSIQERGVQADISLNYNNNGLRVAEEASWVGFGWSLTANATISRIIRGNPDLEGSVLQNNNGGKTYDQIGSQQGIDNLTANRITEGFYDGEPDLFSFNLGNFSGKFVMSQGNAVQLSYQNISIKRVGDNFVITTDDGVKYEFAKREITVLNNAAETYNYPPYVSTWLLTSITSANGSEVIEYIYGEQPEIIQSASNFSIQHTFDGNPPPYTDGCLNKSNNISNSGLTTVTSWRLEKIRSRTTEVLFIPQQQDRLDLYGSSKALSEIHIIDRYSSEIIRKFKFNYDYFGNQADKNSARLKLKSFIQTGINGIVKKPHYFDYYEGTFPSKIGFEQDHWGYYNASGNQSLIPHIYEWQNYGYAIREPNETASRTGMLKKIIYPTKGFSVFTYQQNQYLSGSQSVAGPGLRVTQIEDFDGRLSSFRRYQYDEPIFYGEPFYVKYYTLNNCVCQPIPEGGCMWNMVSCSHYVISGANNSLFAGLSGFALAYRKVVEIAGLSNQVGSTEYIYEASDQYYLDRDIRLKATLVKNKDGDIVKSTVNEYQVVNDRLLYAFRPELTHRKVQCEFFGETPRDPLYDYILNDYNVDAMYAIFSRWVYLKRTTNTDYDLNGEEISTNYSEYTYGSASHRYYTRIEHTQSDGDKLIEFFKYPLDYVLTSDFGSDSYYNALKRLVLQNNVRSIVEYQSIRKTYSGLESVIAAKLLLYREFIEAQNIQVADVYSMESTVPQPVSQSYTSGNTFVFSNLPYTKILSYDYDALGNLLSKQTAHEVTSYLWGYNNTLPILEVKGVPYSILYNAYSESGQSLTALRNHPTVSKFPITTFTHKPLVGISVITDPNLKTNSYTYDELGRLEVLTDADNNIVQTYNYNFKSNFK
ncbi:RHS repeat domain-containing protein [Ohtaekwangia koreensis]|uniref:YD repeat-containing protein n=1 Tax=Ohtaekwangia koreensis TaxID=688867 RepID=A0A1T5J3Y6_9BACT|nr:hypothetical protein [Ohtaekwangia koreensis]SKC46120.1 YD repeat-containing protein [Ohtaekwangia koreensis]